VIAQEDLEPRKGFDLEVSTDGDNPALRKITLSLKTGYRQTVPVYLPVLADRRYVLHQGQVYGNTVYGVPPVEFYWSFINGLGKSRVPTLKVGEVSCVVAEAETEEYGDVLMKAADALEPVEVPDLHNLDKWSYCRASDIMKQALVDAVYEMVDNAIEYNSFNRSPLTRASGACMHLFRWLSHQKTLSEFQIDDAASTVMIPEIFRSWDDASQIRTSILDMSDCSQKSTFNRFSLKKEVFLDEVRSTQK